MGKTNKPKEIDWKKVEQFLKAGATQKRIADHLGIHIDTLRDRTKQQYGMEYSKFSSAMYSEGEMLLEDAQFQKALKNSSPGNTQMLIWLGKVRLGQRESEPEADKAPNQDNLSLSQRLMEAEHELARYRAQVKEGASNADNE